MPGNKKTNKKRKALTSRSPINMQIPKTQQEWLKKVPREAIEAIKAGTFDQTDWFNLGFRIQMGMELVREFYTEDSVKALQECFGAIESIRNRYLSIAPQEWTVTPTELAFLEAAVEAVDTLQDETLRRNQLPASKKALAFMKNYAGITEEQKCL